MNESVDLQAAALAAAERLTAAARTTAVRGAGHGSFAGTEQAMAQAARAAVFADALLGAVRSRLAEIRQLVR
jgi:hypothetical protein